MEWVAMSRSSSSAETSAVRRVHDAGPDRPPDADLIRRVLDGERECYSTLVRRHQDRLYAYARGMDVDHDAALDLVQDALVRAYTSLRSCRDSSRFRIWLLRILRNRCLDHLRSTRERALPLEAAPPIAARDAGGELRSALDEAFSLLPRDLREAFLLRHRDGWSYDEMAEITGASVSALKMRVHRARDTLRLALDDAGIHGSM
jgi:RNA polymerase sigma-70 factor (ECF subfamily)